MKRKLQTGLRYVFSYKKFKKYYRELGVKPSVAGKQLNGRTVKFVNSIGRIDTFVIHPSWCKCIGREN